MPGRESICGPPRLNLRAKQAIVAPTSPKPPKMYEFDRITGHIIGCEFGLPSSRSVLKNICHKCRGNSQISLQSCDLWLCYKCWGNYCDKQQEEWDLELSRCVNLKCDEEEIDYGSRKMINHKNINILLGISPNKLYAHVSRARKSAETMENSPYNTEEYSYSDSDSEMPGQPELPIQSPNNEPADECQDSPAAKRQK